MAVKIITDSTSYIKDEVCKELDIKKISLHVSFSGETFRELEIKNEDFYRMIEERGIPTSSQPSPVEVYEEMRKIVENGNEVVGVFISSKMSGTYSAALTAKEMVLEEFKDARIEIIDSGSNSMQLGFAAIAGAKAAQAGKSFDEVVEAVKETTKRTRFLFVPANLEYLKKGGRIGGARALLASILHIVPILTVENGVVEVVSKIRTKKKAVNEMIEILERDHSLFGIEEIVVHHINVFDEAKELATSIEEKIGIRPEIVDIGPVVGLHVGPGAIGFVYLTRERLLV